MDDVIKLARTYRFTTGLADRLHLAEKIFRTVEPDLRFFVFSAIPHTAAEDVLQEVLKGVVMGLGKFAGSTTGEFWAWCYRIARNKLNDQFRKQATDRLQPIPTDELWQLVKLSAQNAGLSPEDRHDLEYAMGLLTNSKPECYDYLWQHYVFGLAYAEIAGERNLNYDAVRMKIGRCLDEARFTRVLTMSNEKPNADIAMQKLGQRLREGFAKEHPTPENSLTTVKDTVLEQWELEQKTAKEKAAGRSPSKNQERQPPEPGLDR